MDMITLFSQLAVLALLPIFWVPMVVALVILWCLVVHEKGKFATFVTIVFGVMIAAKFPLLVDFISSPLNIVLVVGLYGMVGVLWSRYKWSNFLTKKVTLFVGMREAFLKLNDLPMDYLKTNPEDTDTLSKFVDYINQRITYSARLTTKIASLRELHNVMAPQTSSNKGSIVMWIAYWPISVIWFIVADLVTELAETIYKAVGGHFQKMSDAKFDAI